MACYISILDMVCNWNFDLLFGSDFSHHDGDKVSFFLAEVISLAGYHRTLFLAYFLHYDLLLGIILVLHFFVKF